MLYLIIHILFFAEISERFNFTKLVCFICIIFWEFRKDTDDIKDTLKDLMSGTIQTILEAEIEHELGYAKNSVSEKNSSNSRNGYSKKTVRSEYGNINLDIPRDRNAEDNF